MWYIEVGVLRSFRGLPNYDPVFHHVKIKTDCLKILLLLNTVNAIKDSQTV